MGLRNWMRRLERDSLSDLESFELLDDSIFYHDSGGELYLHCWHCLEAGHPDDWPPPPQILTKVLEAKDPAAALEGIWSPGIGDIFLYSRDAIIHERRLVPRSVVAGRDPYDQVADLSE